LISICHLVHDAKVEGLLALGFCINVFNFIRCGGCMETLEFVIYPDGRVLEKVTGIVGASCAEVTAAIEAQVGQVLHQQPSSEFYASVQVSAQNQSAVSATVNYGSSTQGLSTQSQW
jgi:hypothetical protein